MNNQTTVLVLSRGFTAGDAITTMHLFSKWPKSHLYGASLSFSEYIEGFEDFYLLGNEEVNFRFPFNYLISIPESNMGIKWEQQRMNLKRESIFKKVYENIGRPILQFLDLYENRFSLELSDGFCNWFERICPDVIYTSIGDLAMADFVLKIKYRYPKVKIIIHNFDDWTYPSYSMIYDKKHRQKCESKLYEIFKLSSGLFTSSEKMAFDYEKRYGMEFKCFPNPVKISDTPTKEKKLCAERIVFTGKISWHNNHALRAMINAVEELNKSERKVSFEIFSSDSQRHIEYFLGTLPNSTKILPAIPNKKIMEVLTSATLLYLPINLDERTIKFTKYSMSTKMGEYLASGTPIIYYGPNEIAMTKFLEEKACTIMISNKNKSLLIEAILRGLDSDNSILKDRAKQVSKNYFDINKVSQDFAETIYKIANE